MITIRIYLRDLQSADARYEWEIRDADERIARGTAQDRRQAAERADNWLYRNGYPRMT